MHNNSCKHKTMTATHEHVITSKTSVWNSVSVHCANFSIKIVWSCLCWLHALIHTARVWGFIAECMAIANIFFIFSLALFSFSNDFSVRSRNGYINEIDFPISCRLMSSSQATGTDDWSFWSIDVDVNFRFLIFFSKWLVNGYRIINAYIEPASRLA